MSELKLFYSGYVCIPYLHTPDSAVLRDVWINSKNIENMYFATGTFSSESKLYFPDSTNHYILAKFKDSEQISKDLSDHNQEKTSFVFDIKDGLFQREQQGDVNFVSVYYLEYGDDLQEIADLLLKRDKIEMAGFGNMKTFCLKSSKFTFPYSENIAVIEISGEKSYQSMKKYCDQTRRDANRKGMAMTSLMNLSILEKLK